MGLAHFATFLGLADSALPGFWLANQVTRKYYIINSTDIMIIIMRSSNSNCKVSTACASVSGANTYVLQHVRNVAMEPVEVCKARYMIPPIGGQSAQQTPVIPKLGISF